MSGNVPINKKYIITNNKKLHNVCITHDNGIIESQQV